MTNQAKLEKIATERGAVIRVDGFEVELLCNPGRCIDSGSHIALEEYGAGTSNRSLAAACGALLDLASSIGSCYCSRCESD